MPAAKTVTKAVAAKILGIYTSEVSKVAGEVVTTIDDQRYQLTGDKPGDYRWIREETPAVDDESDED